MKHLTILALAVPALTACATNAASPPDTALPATACNNDALQRFVGRPATSELGTAILRAAGVKNLQWVAAGTMVTMDFRADRVRAYLDERNQVQRISCG